MNVRLVRGADGVLSLAAGDRLHANVRVLRAAPLSDPDRYISIVDTNNDEIAMIKDLADLDAETRRVVRQELEDRYMTLTIRRVNSARTESGEWYLEVETNLGPRIVGLRDVPETVRRIGSRLLICDLDGNRYEVPDISRLERRSANVLERMLQLS
jgi:hypothetical protein